MTKITIDDVLREKLLNLETSLEICDEAGRVLARVELTSDESKANMLAPQIDEEELTRRAKSTGSTYTTEDVLDRLKSL